MDPFAPLSASTSKNSQARVLHGLTIMAIEDSRAASEAIRLMGVACGARIRRADSLHAARRHLAIYRPNVVVVDLGLPDGTGLDVIAELSQSVGARPVIIAISGDGMGEWQQAARDAGADATLEKPIESIKVFSDAILDVLPDGEARRSGTMSHGHLGIEPGTESLATDFEHAIGAFEDALLINDVATLRYAGRFVVGLGRELRDPALSKSAIGLLQSLGAPEFPEKQLQDLTDLLTARLRQLQPSQRKVSNG